MLWLSNRMDMNAETATAAVMAIVAETAGELGLHAVLSSNRRPRGMVGGSKSYHEFGFAWDFVFSKLMTDPGVTPITDTEGWNLRNQLQERLGRHFDVVWHDTGSGLHIHIEWDPDPRRDDDPLVGV